MKRQTFFCCLASVALCGAAEPRPNILLLIGDNWLYDHAGANGDPVVKTPVFDRIARDGARFTHAFCPVPSCAPTRSCIVTGRAAHQLADAASLWSKFDGKLRVFGDALTQSGYQVGFTGKGWSPGNFKDFGRSENPAGKQFKDFPGFMAERKTEQPFFFWFGSVHTSLHQWKAGTGKEHGIDPEKVRVPAYLPDTAEVREEVADYLAADPAHEKTKQQLSTRVDQWMRETSDPRVDPANDSWDSYPYFGGKAKPKTPTRRRSLKP